MVHALHRYWKPTKQVAAAGPDAASIRIRIHRCLCWMQSIEDIDAIEEKSLDARTWYIQGKHWHIFDRV